MNVRAAFGCRDDVHERSRHRFVVGSPPHGDIDATLAQDLLRAQVPLRVDLLDDLREGTGTRQMPHVGHGLIGSEELNEVNDPAVMPKLGDDWLLSTKILHPQHQAGNEEGRLPRTLDKPFDVEGLTSREDLAIRPVPDARARDLAGTLPLTRGMVAVVKGVNGFAGDGVPESL